MTVGLGQAPAQTQCSYLHDVIGPGQVGWRGSIQLPNGSQTFSTGTGKVKPGPGRTGNLMSHWPGSPNGSGLPGPNHTDNLTDHRLDWTSRIATSTCYLNNHATLRPVSAQQATCHVSMQRHQANKSLVLAFQSKPTMSDIPTNSCLPHQRSPSARLPPSGSGCGSWGRSSHRTNYRRCCHAPVIFWFNK